MSYRQGLGPSCPPYSPELSILCRTQLVPDKKGAHWTVVIEDPKARLPLGPLPPGRGSHDPVVDGGPHSHPELILLFWDTQSRLAVTGHPGPLPQPSLTPVPGRSPCAVPRAHLPFTGLRDHTSLTTGIWRPAQACPPFTSWRQGPASGPKSFCPSPSWSPSALVPSSTIAPFSSSLRLLSHLHSPHDLPKFPWTKPLALSPPADPSP